MGQHMSLQMVDFDKGDLLCEGKTFGKRSSYQQGTKQAWSTRKGDSRDFVGRYACFFNCHINYGNNILLVCPRCQFWNDTPIKLMDQLT